MLEFINKGTGMKAQRHPLEKVLEDRIAIIDGAMGTTIRTYGMKEADMQQLASLMAESIKGKQVKDQVRKLRAAFEEMQYV